MSTTGIGQLLTNLLNDVKNFKEQVEALDGSEIFPNYRVNREWDALVARHNSLRTSMTMLTPEERQDFFKRYSRERDELAELMDKLSDLVKEKSHTRKDVENGAKWGTIIGGALITVGKIVYDLYFGKKGGNTTTRR